VDFCINSCEHSGCDRRWFVPPWDWIRVWSEVLLLHDINVISLFITFISVRMAAHTGSSNIMSSISMSGFIRYFLYSGTSIYRSRIRRPISMVPERILFQLWLPHLLFSWIHCSFFRPPTKTMNRGFPVLGFPSSLFPDHFVMLCRNTSNYPGFPYMFLRNFSLWCTLIIMTENQVCVIHTW
jgi:hypothetical protein